MTSTNTPTCGHTESAFSTIYRLDALAIAAQTCGLFGTCFDHSHAQADVTFTFHPTRKGGIGTSATGTLR